MSFHKSRKRRTMYFRVNHLENGTLLVADLTPNSRSGNRGIVLEGSKEKYNNKYIMFNTTHRINLLLTGKFSLVLIPQTDIMATLVHLNHSQNRFNVKKWYLIMKFVRKHALHGGVQNYSAIAQHVERTLKPSKNI